MIGLDALGAVRVGDFGTGAEPSVPVRESDLARDAAEAARLADLEAARRAAGGGGGGGSPVNWGLLGGLAAGALGLLGLGLVAGHHARRS